MDDEERAFTVYARGLTERIAERAKGLDEGSKRIARARPADRVLAGFLTPQKARATDHNENTEDELTRELPTDEPHEQTSIGLEWLVPDIAIQTSACEFRVECSVYVRRIPDPDEVLAGAEWRKNANETERRTELVPIWTREPIELGTVPVPLAQIDMVTGWPYLLDEQIRDEVARIPV